MKLGIVGHAADKFTQETEQLARAILRAEIVVRQAAEVVSGRSPLGGVDVWAEEVAAELGVPTLIHPPKARSWGAPGGYRDRNLAIARDSDLVLVVVVSSLPPDYKGMRFSGCYHCRDRNPIHVKSGGCWTAWKAKAHVWRIVE